MRLLGATQPSRTAPLLTLEVSSRPLPDAGSTGYSGSRVLLAVLSGKAGATARLFWRVRELTAAGRERHTRTFPDREMALLAYYTGERSEPLALEGFVEILCPEEGANVNWGSEHDAVVHHGRLAGPSPLRLVERFLPGGFFLVEAWSRHPEHVAVFVDDRELATITLSGHELCVSRHPDRASYDAELDLAEDLYGR